jgi:hypothetical protein
MKAKKVVKKPVTTKKTVKRASGKKPSFKQSVIKLGRKKSSLH